MLVFGMAPAGAGVANCHGQLVKEVFAPASHDQILLQIEISNSAEEDIEVVSVGDLHKFYKRTNCE